MKKTHAQKAAEAALKRAEAIKRWEATDQALDRALWVRHGNLAAVTKENVFVGRPLNLKR